MGNTRQSLAASDFSQLLEAIRTKAESRAFREAQLADIIVAHLALYHEARLGLTAKQLGQLLEVFEAAKAAR